MKDQAAVTPTKATEPDPRLAPVLNDEKNRIDPVKLGRIESKHRDEQSLTAEEQGVLDVLLEHLGAQVGFLLHEAVVQFDAWCQQYVSEHGGRVERETHRVRRGRHTIRRRGDHFPPPKSARIVDRAPRSKPRARGAGRPKAQATRSSVRSGDSGEDGESSGESSEPPARRLCAFCGNDLPAGRPAQARYCTKQHADRDRQRRQRARDRARDVRPKPPKTADWQRMQELPPWERERLYEFAVCRCNGKHLEFDPGQCCRCGRALPAKNGTDNVRIRSFVARLVREAEERNERAVVREREATLSRLGAVVA